MNYSQPTLKSTASRFPALKSSESCRGAAVFDNRVHVFESHIELIVLYCLITRPDVAKVFDQPAPVYYVDENGTGRSHTFDFLIVMADGTRHFIAVKPAARVARSGILDTLNLIAEQIPVGLADSVHLVTDADFTRADRFNATQAFECSRFPIAEHDEIIDRITADMIGAVRIADLVDASGLGGMAFRAVVRLIARGSLVPVASTRITPEAYVHRRQR